VKRRRLLAAATAAAAAACAPFRTTPIGTNLGSRVDQLLASMSPAARAGQLMSIAFHGTKITPALEAMIRGRSVGGVILYSENFDGDAAKLRALTAELARIAAEAKTVPLFCSIDQEGGAVVRISRGATILPGNMALAATPDPADSVRKAAAITARDLRTVGVNFELAPDADVNNESRNPIILNRSFGSDPQRVAALVRVAVQAYADAGFLCCAKHFPGHGATTTDSHTGLPLLDVDRARLDAVELVPFRAAIAAGVPAIMSAHIEMPALDPTPGLPVTLSPRVMIDLVRTQLGFGGLLVTDDLEMGALTQTRPESQAGYDAFVAGADYLLFRFDESAQIDAHARLVRGMGDGRRARASEHHRPPRRRPSASRPDPGLLAGEPRHRVRRRPAHAWPGARPVAAERDAADHHALANAGRDRPRRRSRTRRGRGGDGRGRSLLVSAAGRAGQGAAGGQADGARVPSVAVRRPVRARCGRIRLRVHRPRADAPRAGRGAVRRARADRHAAGRRPGCLPYR
jgi:beta-glucosidase-like glycosyl hydrolase